MSRSQRLSYREVRQVSELVGESVEMGRDPNAWRTHALAGLVNLTRGRVGLTIDIDGMPGSAPPRMIDPIDMGFDEGSRQTFYRDYLEVMGEDPGTQALGQIHAKARFVTATRRELVDDPLWYAAPAVSQMRRSSGIDDFVFTSVQIRPNVLQGFIVYRDWGQSPFGLRERRIMRLFHAGVLREHARDGRDNPAVNVLATLPPRVKQTLDHMLTGQSLKEIAASLQISRHTVNDYTKYLHKRFGVSSRAELLSTIAKIPSSRLNFPTAVWSQGLAVPAAATPVN